MMKAFLFVLMALPRVLVAQSNVDKIVEQLEFFGKGSIDSWKYSTSFVGDPTKTGFDDSQWKPLKLNESIFVDSCWIRKEVILPKALYGEPVRGRLRFLVSVDDYGYMWINGDSKGRFPWNGEFDVTADAKPGNRIVFAIKAINTGGPLRLIRAKLEAEAAASTMQTIEDLSLSLRVGQKLLSFDTYQTNSSAKVDPGIEKSSMDRAEKQRLANLLQQLATQIDVKALENGETSKFLASLSGVRTQLKPISDFAKRFTLSFDANAHIDAAWLWRQVETIEVCKNTFASVINMMEARPDFTYTQSAAAYYDWMERLYPNLFEKIRQRVQERRWEVVGGMWVEPDCNLPSGESWVRHLLYARRYFRQKLGVDVKIGWNPDSFGYNWNMPQFYRNAGIDAFVTQKIGWNDTNVFPYRVFWWEAPDGSRMLSYFPFDYVNEVSDPYRFVDWLRQFEANTGFTNMLVLFGVGDHGGGPSLEMLKRIDRLAQLDIFPTIKHGTATAYLDWLKEQDLSSVPVWNDELYLEYHQGTYTTQAAMKRQNRESETLLTNAEKFSSLAAQHGGTYNAADLEQAWRLALFNQFHDILPGSSIREVYVDANETYAEVRAIGQTELNRALQQLVRSVNTSRVKQGTPLVVFNPLAWDRSEFVHVVLPRGDGGAYAVFDMSGKELPSQIRATSRYERELTFRADHVPSLGYKLFELRQQLPRQHPTTLSITPSSIENEFFRIEVDRKTGWLKSIVDKRNGRELLVGPGNELHLLADYPKAWDAWNIGLTGVKYPSKFRKAEIVEEGPARAVLRLYRDYLKPGVQKEYPTEEFPSSFFTQEIILYAGVDQIYFKTDVDWWEEKTMLKVAFPLTVSDTVATYEIPYGTIRRSTQLRNSWEKAKVEVPAQRWADLSQNDYGVSLLNKAKYGYDIKGDTIRLSLLRSPKWPDPTADRGKHSIDYALYPHAKRWTEANTVRRGYEYNNPLLAVVTNGHNGQLPESYSFINLEPENLVLTTVKKAEDSDAWVVQWYDAKGQDVEAELTLPKVPKKVVRTNFLEEDREALPFSRNTVRLRTSKNAVVTVKIFF